MKIYTLHAKQNLPITVDQVWDFLSDPKKLAQITPNTMKFIILSKENKPMYPGQIIEYLITPILGIKIKWVTEITHVIDKSYFVDEQRYGPYSLWHHKHFIKAIPGGVEMEDLIHYKMPFGLLGKIIHSLLVRPKLKEIFEFRRKQLNAIFGEFPN